MAGPELVWEPSAAPVEAVFYEAPRRNAPAPPRPSPPPPAAPRPAPVRRPPPPPAAAVPPPTDGRPGKRLDWRTFRWQTWQLVAICAAAAIGGMVVGNASRPSTHASTGSAQAAPHASARRTASTSAAQHQPAAGPPPTTSAPTTVTTAAPAPAAAAGPAILLDLKRETGPMTTQHFTATGPRWTLGWAYDCTGEGGAGSFKVSIVNGDGTPSQDGGVDQQGAKGSSVAAYGSTGDRYLVVQTACVWAVKVTS